jgi:hypothetical protein
MSAINWDICLEGRSWSTEELRSRYNLIPEKIQLIQGELFWSGEARLNMLGLLLEDVGVEKVIRLGNPKVRHQAISQLEESR